jgi:hypothetical protein
LVKLGYYLVDPKVEYWAQIDRTRGLLDGWAKLARRYNVRVLYHTHSSWGSDPVAAPVALFPPLSKCGG